MNWLKTLLLLCSCIPFGVVAEAVKTHETTLVADAVEDNVPVKMSDNLHQRNPFVPFKIGRALPENIETSSDFDFLSWVSYRDHQEFSLKEKTKDKSFWISSDNKIKNNNYSIVFRNFYPTEKTLVVQDTINGNMMHLKLKESQLASASSSSSLLGSGTDWSSFFLDDDDDDDDILPVKSTKDIKLTKDKK